MDFRWSRLLGAVTLALLVCAGADALNNRRVWFVPWKVLEPGSVAPETALTLYWIPASPDELRRSELLTSRALTIYASRCVAMHVIRLNDTARLANLRAGGVQPAAILFEGDVEIGRVDISAGAFGAPEVEAMVRRVLDTREVQAERDLDEARRKTASGDREAAAAIYRGVVRQRCAFPRLAKEAQRALRKLEKD